MNLYKLHSNPKTLKGHDVAYEKNPDLAWETFYAPLFSNPAVSKQTEYRLKQEVIKRKHLWAKDPYKAYTYAKNVIHKPFPEGETAIATDPDYSMWYARFVLHHRFPEGEPAIAQDVHAKRRYEDKFGIKL